MIVSGETRWISIAHYETLRCNVTCEFGILVQARMADESAVRAINRRLRLSESISIRLQGFAMDDGYECCRLLDTVGGKDL